MDPEENAQVNTERQTAVSALIDAYSYDHKPQLTDGPKIKVSAAVSTLASAYEKFRQAMEYNEPHLLRRAATDRILARRLRAESNSLLVAKGLVNELIRGRYLKNDHYPESLIEVVGSILEKYRLILHYRDMSTASDDFPWVIRLASAEIEEFLVSPYIDDALANLMLANIKDTITLSDPSLDETHRLIQLRLAVHKNLFKFDKAMLEFNVFELFYPYWKQHGHDHVKEVASGLPQLKSAMDKIISYPLGGSLTAMARRYTSPFSLLKDSLEREGTAILSDKELFARSISSSYAKRVARERKRLTTTATRALIYIFLTKAVLSFAFELPAESLIYGAVKRVPFLVNFLLPPFLLFLLTLSISPPGKSNEGRVISAAKEAVFGEGKAFSDKNRVEVKKRGSSTSFTLFSIYLLTFVLIFGGISYLLNYFGFTPFAIALFLFYTSVVTYFGVKVRESSKELVMAGGKETVGSVTFDFFALPFLRLGSFVSAGLARFNVLVLFISLMVEAPIQVLLEFLEEWIHFAKEKKEEVY